MPATQGTSENRGGASWQRHNLADHDDALTGLSGDLVWLNNAVGPVIKDTSNGNTYRIKVTGGVLGVTQIT